MGHLIGEYDAAGDLIQETVWFGDIPVATLKPNGGSGVSVFYIHTDHLSTPRRITRPSDNAILWRWDSDPFGGAPANDDPDADTVTFAYHLRFPGQYFDAETGLHYNYFRDYDPVTGRYMQSDPIGLEGGINTYAYADGNPLRYIDPLGLSFDSVSAGCMQQMDFCLENGLIIMDSAVAVARRREPLACPAIEDRRTRCVGVEGCEADGQFRVVYVVKRNDRIYVLHAFQKKTQQTSQQDIGLARARFKEI